MLNSLELLSRSFAKPSIEISFDTYLEVLIKYFNTTSANMKYHAFYSQIFARMTAFNKDYFRMADWYYFLTQLLFGIRAVEFKTLRCIVGKCSLELYILSAKGSVDRYLKFSLSSPLIKLYCNILLAKPILVEYKPYYRALKRANPNFYDNIDCTHLSVTHLTRHFLCQCLRYVLKLRRVDISRFFGWFNQHTINNYTDLSFWKGLRGIHECY